MFIREYNGGGRKDRRNNNIEKKHVICLYKDRLFNN